MSKPIVAIVGRPNVGKSMLFNKIIGRRLHCGGHPRRDPRPAVCRVLSGEADLDIVDTGGIEPRTDDQILAFMREQAEIAIQNATVILFLCDIKTGHHRLRPGGGQHASARPQAGGAGGEQDGPGGPHQSRLL